MLQGDLCVGGDKEELFLSLSVVLVLVIILVVVVIVVILYLILCDSLQSGEKSKNVTHEKGRDTSIRQDISATSAPDWACPQLLLPDLQFEQNVSSGHPNLNVANLRTHLSVSVREFWRMSLLT
jgi:hypothetical protein